MTGVAKQLEQAPTIEFWFEIGSNYSYLSVMRIEEAARRHGVRIAWKPFLLGPIFRVGHESRRKLACQADGALQGCPPVAAVGA